VLGGLIHDLFLSLACFPLSPEDLPTARRELRLLLFRLTAAFDLDCARLLLNFLLLNFS
jgi:hypothetical protein